MIVVDEVKFHINGKGFYENLLDDSGREHESLDGVGLTDGCYCKHYTKRRDWSEKDNRDEKDRPHLQSYCEKYRKFLGWAYCCGTGAKCFEKGKSAGVKRVLSRIRKRRAGV